MRQITFYQRWAGSGLPSECLSFHYISPRRAAREIRLDTGLLRIISPTGCVKDRLAAYYHWNDVQSPEQGVLVADSVDIDPDEVERSSIVKGKGQEFSKVRHRFTSRAT